MTQDYTLAAGTHATPEQGRCAMEWVSYLAGEPHSDEPACVSPALRAICIALNDGLAAGPRQKLRPYLARTIGTAGDGRDPERGWQALDWLVRVFTPAWLTLAELEEAAAALQSLEPVEGPARLTAALAGLEAARTSARGARSRAYTRSWAGGRGGGGWVSGIAASRAGRQAAWACAGEAVWAAARTATPDSGPAEARTGAIVRTIAGEAAAVGARHQARDEVCGEIDRRRLLRGAVATTLDELADRAIELLAAMLVTEPLVGFAPEDPRPTADPADGLLAGPAGRLG